MMEEDNNSLNYDSISNVMSNDTHNGNGDLGDYAPLAAATDSNIDKLSLSETEDPVKREAYIKVKSKNKNETKKSTLGDAQDDDKGGDNMSQIVGPLNGDVYRKVKSKKKGEPEEPSLGDAKLYRNEEVNIVMM